MNSFFWPVLPLVGVVVGGCLTNPGTDSNSDTPALEPWGLHAELAYENTTFDGSIFSMEVHFRQAANVSVEMAVHGTWGGVPPWVSPTPPVANTTMHRNASTENIGLFVVLASEYLAFRDFIVGRCLMDAPYSAFASVEGPVAAEKEYSLFAGAGAGGDCSYEARIPEFVVTGEAGDVLHLVAMVTNMTGRRTAAQIEVKVVADTEMEFFDPWVGHDSDLLYNETPPGSSGFSASVSLPRAGEVQASSDTRLAASTNRSSILVVIPLPSGSLGTSEWDYQTPSGGSVSSRVIADGLGSAPACLSGCTQDRFLPYIAVDGSGAWNLNLHQRTCLGTRAPYFQSTCRSTLLLLPFGDDV